MIYNSGLLQVSGALLVTTGAPVDCRYVVAESASLAPGTFLNTFKFGDTFTFYEGMLVYAQDTQKIYILKYTRDDNGNITKRNFEELKTGSDINENDIVNIVTNNNFVNTTTLNNALSIYAKKDDITGLYKIKEPLDNIDGLRALNPEEVSVGDVHNIRDRFTIEVELTNGDKQLRTYPSGTNVVCFRIDEVLQNKVENDEVVINPETQQPVVETVKIPRWDALGGVSEFDWIDIVEEPKDPESGTDPEPEPEPEPGTEPTA